MIKVFQTGILPLGHFDITDSDLASIEGGEVLVFDTAPTVAGERVVPDVYQNGARSNLRLANENDIGPFFLANMDKTSGQFSTPGFEKTSAFSTNTTFAQEYDSSSKVSIFAEEGFYSISLDRFEDGYVTQNTPINTRLYVGPNGLLTTDPSLSAAIVGYFVEYRQNSVLNNNLNRPFYTAGTHTDQDSVIIFKANSDGYLDWDLLSQAAAETSTLGTPLDGYYTDGYHAFTATTRVADAVDDINETIQALATIGPDLVTVASVTTDYILGSIDGVVFADASSGALNVTLPVSTSGRRVTVKKTDATGFIVTIVPSGGQLIENAVDAQISSFGNSLTLVSDGSDWWVI